jgi:hypothetical protein
LVAAGEVRTTRICPDRSRKKRLCFLLLGKDLKSRFNEEFTVTLDTEGSTASNARLTMVWEWWRLSRSAIRSISSKRRPVKQTGKAKAVFAELFGQAVVSK